MPDHDAGRVDPGAARVSGTRYIPGRVEPDSLPATRDAYDTVATRYAQHFTDTLRNGPLERALLAAFAESVRAGGEGEVADVGCGPGRITAHLGRLGLRAFGVDASPAMIGLARAPPSLGNDTPRSTRGVPSVSQACAGPATPGARRRRGHLGRVDTRLEQGRASRPSREILTVLARAFRLSNAERDHLFRLADERPPQPRAPAAEIRPGLQQLLDSLDDTMPVTIHDGRLDMLAFNVAAADLLGPIFDDGPYGHNIVYQAFTSAGLREVLGNEGAEQLSRVSAAELRKALGLHPEDEHPRSLFRELSTSSPEFSRHGDRGEIGTWRSAMKRVNHPTRGLLAFDSEMLHDPENDHWVMLFTPRSA